MAHRGASVTNCNLIVMHGDKGKNTEPVRQEQIKVCFIFVIFNLYENSYDSCK